MPEKKPLLTISLLISDRLDTIPRCLDSLRPIMDEIPCELILIDTSKNPQVNKLLLNYTNQVYEFEWCQDFAKARNEGLKRASGEWFMYLDDDEWFVDAEEIVNFFKSGEYNSFAYATYIVRNFTDQEYAHYSEDWTTRLVSIEDDVRFVGKIHECFWPIRGKRKDLFSIANHDGYIYETPEKRMKHFERNYPLILDMIKEDPNNLRWRLFLAQEYRAVEKWKELVDFSKESIEFIKNENSDSIKNHIATFYEGWMLGLISQSEYQEAIRVGEHALEDKRCKEVLRAKTYLRLAECYVYIRNFAKTVDYAEKYLQLLSSIDRNTNEMREQELALMVGDAFADVNQEFAHHIMIAHRLGQGLIDESDLSIIVEALEKQELRKLFQLVVIENEIETSNEFISLFQSLMHKMQVVIDGPKCSNLIEYHESLQAYVQSVCQWHDFIEAEDGIQLDYENTPGYLYAAILISEYFELEQEDIVKSLGKLKEAVVVFPEFAEGIGAFIHNYGVLGTQRIEKRRNEMEALRMQVVEQVKMMLDVNQIEEARQILAQLGKMFPGDFEIEELAKGLRE